MGSDVDVLVVEYPGHGRRINERFRSSIEQISAEIVDALEQLHAPFALCGHSMGSLVAFECCRQLSLRHTQLPFALVVCAHRAPHLPPRKPLVHPLPDPNFLQRVRALNATPPEVFSSPELRALMMPILRADFRVCEQYITGEHVLLDVAIYGYEAIDDPDVSAEEMMAWSSHTGRASYRRLFTGGHFFVQNDIRTVSQALRTVCRQHP